MLNPGDKVVLTAFGTHGDIVPFVSIGKRLQARGIRPLIATSDYYRALVESQGLAFCAIAPDEAQLACDLGDPFSVLIRKAMHKMSGPRFGITRVVLPYLAQTHAQLAAACQGAAMLVSHTYAFAAPLVAERTGIRWRSLCLQPLSLLSAHDPAVLSEFLPIHRLQPWLGLARYRWLLNGVEAATRGWMRPVTELRRELGLPASRRHPLFEAQFAPEGVFAMFDPVLIRDARGLPANLHFAGFGHSDGTDGLLPAELNDFLRRGDAPIVFTLGTSAVHNPGRFYEVASASCRRLGRRAVFLCGGNEVSRGLPETQLAIPWASHAGLFPKAAAVVHQGGMGTCGQALRAGVPQLVVPFANDQPDNAERLAGLGVALTMRSWRIGEPRMCDALDRLLAGDSFAIEARRVRRSLLPQDGAETVARMLTAGAGACGREEAIDSPAASPPFSGGSG